MSRAGLVLLQVLFRHSSPNELAGQKVLAAVQREKMQLASISADSFRFARTRDLSPSDRLNIALPHRWRSPGNELGPDDYYAHGKRRRGGAMHPPTSQENNGFD
jgi:hypothetical protein